MTELKIFKPAGHAIQDTTNMATTFAIKTATSQTAQGIPFPLVRLTAIAQLAPKPPLTAPPTGPNTSSIPAKTGILNPAIHASRVAQTGRRSLTEAVSLVPLL